MPAEPYLLYALIVACEVAFWVVLLLALVDALVLLVGDSAATRPLLAWHRQAFGCVVLWFFFGPVWSLASAWRSSR